MQLVIQLSGENLHVRREITMIEISVLRLDNSEPCLKIFQSLDRECIELHKLKGMRFVVPALSNYTTPEFVIKIKIKNKL